MVHIDNLRKQIFWGLEYLKGGRLIHHLQDIRELLNPSNLQYSRSKEQLYLENILRHAANTTPFYKKYAETGCYSDFPIINKNIIRNNKQSFLSHSYKNKKVFESSTSGSTGAVLRVFKDKNKLLRNTADTLFFSELAGFKIGYKLLYLRIWLEHFKKHPFKAWQQNILPINILDLNDNYISNLIQLIEKDKSKKGWLGYASGFEVICNYLDRKNSKSINGNIKSIISISESLNSYTKQAMEKYFGVPVVSRYSNNENGIIAQQSKDSNGNYIINWASYYVEILDFDNDKPVAPGSFGRIIITDLFNYAMPLIRYDTGDVGSFATQTNPPMLKNVEGRKSDIIYNTAGQVVSSMIIGNILKYKEVVQAQIIQEKKSEYRLVLNVTSKFNQEKDILKEYKNYLGKDANILVEYVDEIPRLKSGKRKVTINNYKN